MDPLHMTSQAHEVKRKTSIGWELYVARYMGIVWLWWWLPMPGVYWLKAKQTMKNDMQRQELNPVSSIQLTLYQ